MAKNNILQSRVSNRINYYIEKVCEMEKLTISEYIRKTMEEKVLKDIKELGIEEIREF